MCKVNTKTSSRSKRKNNKNKRNVIKDDQAAKSKTYTKPAIMKKVFGNEETGSINSSNFSDSEITHKSNWSKAQKKLI